MVVKNDLLGNSSILMTIAEQIDRPFLRDPRRAILCQGQSMQTALQIFELGIALESVHLIGQQRLEDLMSPLTDILDVQSHETKRGLCPELC